VTNFLKTEISSLSLRFIHKKLFYLDQTLIPEQEKWCEAFDLKEVIEAIKLLKIRGAPAIAFASGLFVAQEIYKNPNISYDEIVSLALSLTKARPTAVNIFNLFRELVFNVSISDFSTTVFLESLFFKIREDQKSSEKMAKMAMTLLPKTTQLEIMTYCNTGALATMGKGTALGVIYFLHQAKRLGRVWVPETRPLFQGGRLTAWECLKMGANPVLFSDNMISTVFSRHKIEAVLVGADRIASNGDVANKIGTLSLAIMAKHYKIPFYVVATSETLDPSSTSGENFCIEERSEEEIKGANFFGKNLQWAPSEVSCFNPAFDVTPASLISGIIFENRIWFPQR